MKAIIRTQASSLIGTGHARRCMTLADALQQRGIETTFAVDRQTVAVLPQLSQFRIILPCAGGLSPLPPSDLVLFDGYHFDAADHHAARHSAKYLAAVDDLADRTYDVDLLIDATQGRKVETYRPLCPANAEILTGAEYALLRPQFAQYRASALAARDKPDDRLFVAFGGTDQDAAIQLTLRAIAGLDKVPVIDLISANAPRWQTEAKALGLALTVHHNVTEMATLMSGAKLAIGAGGQTSYERCCLGLPALLMELADNQRDNLNALDHIGAAVNLGPVETLTVDVLQQSLSDCLDNPDRLAKMSKASAAVTDGLGTARIADRIAAMLNSAKR